MLAVSIFEFIVDDEIFVQLNNKTIKLFMLATKSRNF